MPRSLMVLAALAALAAPAAAQSDRPLASRGELTQLASRLEGNDAERVRARLTQGDFRPGDLVLLEVQGEAALNDTFRVGPDTTLRLPAPTTGSLSMVGVLRRELDSVMTRYIGRFINNPVVQARSLLWISIQGEVNRPGFYGVPTDANLANAVMAAAGTTTRADMGKIRLERNGRPIARGEELQQRIASGQTLDEAELRSGDQIVVGRRGDGFNGGLRTAWTVVSLGVGVYTLSRIF